MLGRLKMTVENCIEAFRIYSKAIFNQPRLLYYLKYPGPKYSNKTLRSAINKVIEEHEPNKDGDTRWKKDTFAAVGDYCKTWVSPKYRLLRCLIDI
jgi:hypothetical protein